MSFWYPRYIKKNMSGKRKTVTVKYKANEVPIQHTHMSEDVE